MKKCTQLLIIILCVILHKNCAKGQLNDDFSDIIGNVDINEADLTSILSQISIDKICERVNEVEQVNACSNQLSIVCQNDTFKMRMMDANSKLPYTGMLVKTRLDLGTYDECIDLDVTVNNSRVLGKHCTAGIIIPTTQFNDSNAFELAYKLSTCIPHGCKAMDLLNIMNLSYVYPLFNDFSCSTKETYKGLKWYDYAAIIFFTSLFLLMAIATLYDIYYYYFNIDYPNVLLQAFSMLHNGQKLFKTSKGSTNQINVIHGLRVISMMWIVMAHTFSVMLAFPGLGIDFQTNFEWTRTSMYITTGHLAVDTFFFISGFLLSYQYLKLKPTSVVNHLKRIPSMVFHRYVRLTPVVASAFIVLTTVLMHMGNGPIYTSSLTEERNVCLNHWWSYFTYTQNYVNYNELCMTHTWYISADWQLFLVSPFILIPVAMLVKTSFKWVMGQLLILNLIFTFLPIALKLLLEDYDNTYETHTRLNDYFIGFMLGVYMREKTNNKFRLTTKTNVIIWICMLSVMVVTAVSYKEIQLLAHSKQDNSLTTYFILLRSFWSIGTGWIIYACHNGYGGFINWILTTQLVQVLSKLTFCMYMLHACPVLYMKLIIRTPIEYSQLTAIKDTIIAYMTSLVISVVWTMAFESPLITIEKYFLRKRGKD